MRPSQPARRASPYLPPVAGSMAWIFRPDARSGIGYQDSTIAGGDRGTEQTIEKMVKLSQDGANHPGIREAAQRAIRMYNVQPKDYQGELAALYQYVKANCRYALDPRGKEQLSHPAHTLFVSGTEDCFRQGTLVLRRAGHALVPIESLRPGDEIWGYDRWSVVTNSVDKGVLPTSLVRLSNGSSMRLTPGHYAWVARCDRHANRKRGTGLKYGCSCRLDERRLERVTVESLRSGDVLVRPDSVPWGTGDYDPRRAYVEGLYASDGYMHAASFHISGRDGFPREEQKREVLGLCEQLGIETAWGEKSISVHDPEWAARMRSMGSFAWTKRLATLDLAEAPSRELLRGVLADSGRCPGSARRDFTTSSRALCVQARVLLKSLGLPCSEAYIVDHGSTSKHPIWRLHIPGHVALDSLGVIRDRAWRDDAPVAASPNRKAFKLLRVREVINDGAEEPCWDVSTDDHFVWLPEADWTVSQCDSLSILLAAMAGAMGHGAVFRAIKADPARPDEYSHVYVVLMYRDAQGVHYVPADVTTLNKPFGWEPPLDQVYFRRDWVAIPP